MDLSKWFNLDHRPKIKEWDDLDSQEREFYCKNGWAERKRDGHRLTVIRWPDGDNFAYGKKPYNLFQQLSRSLQESIASLPAGTILDGELYAKTDEASDVSHLLAANSDKLDFEVFAVPRWANQKFYLQKESGVLELKQRAKEYGFSVAEHLDPTTCSRESAEKLGYEGYVFKRLNYQGWHRLKVYQTVDVFVVGVAAGKDGKFSDCWGALQVAVYDGDKEVVVASVGKGKDKEWRWNSLGQLVGRVCEITHEGVQAKGKLKFSSFLRWRDDKTPEMCTMEQLE